MTDANRSSAALHDRTRFCPTLSTIYGVDRKAPGFEIVEAALGARAIWEPHKTLRNALEHFIETGVAIFEAALRPGGELHKVAADIIYLKASTGGAPDSAAADTRIVCDLWKAPGDSFFQFSDPQLLQRGQFLRVAQPLLEQVGKAVLRRWGRAAGPARGKHFDQVSRALRAEIIDRLRMRRVSIRDMLTRMADQPLAIYLADGQTIEVAPG